MNRLLLRVDATTAGGLGHGMRAVALAEEAVARDWTVIVAGDIAAGLVRDAFDLLGVGMVGVRNGVDALADAARTSGADVVHVDDYALGDGLSSAVGGSAIVSSIEDGVWGRRDADVVVDPHPDAERRHRDGAPTNLLAGPTFAPIRRAIRMNGHPPPARPRRVVVVLGGTDAAGATAAVVDRVARVPGVERVDAVGTREHRMIKSVVVRPVERTASPADLVADADLVVTAAGTSIWEFAMMGVPMAVVQVVDNQEQNYAWAVGTDIAVGLRTLDHVLAAPTFSAAVTTALRDVRAAGNRVRRGREIVDGGGARRIVDEWEAQIAGSGLRVRPARVGDASPLFAWRNDPVTRAASRNTAVVDWGDHVRWVQRAIESTERDLLVVEADHRPVATVRFDREPLSGHWEVSITVAPEARGTGAGRRALRAAVEQFRGDHPDVRALSAEFRRENAASIRLFSAAGFTLSPASEATGLMRSGLRFD